MGESPKDSRPPVWDKFKSKIAESEKRRLRAQKERTRSLWFGMGTFGIVGWSIAIPTLLGVALGYWLDTLWPDAISWKLNLLLIGVILGCWNAWIWVTKHSPPWK